MDNEWKDGLPPVGAECEYSWNDAFWHKGVFHGKTQRGMEILERAEGQVDLVSGYTYRPIKSEADKMREEHVEKIAIELEDFLDGNHKDVAEIIYVQGCRMTRELTPEAIEKIIERFIPQGANFEAMELAAAYVRGELEV